MSSVARTLYYDHEPITCRHVSPSLLSTFSVLLSGEDSIEIVEPFPQKIFFLEFTSGDVTCVALDSSGAKDPPKITFMRRDDNNNYHKLKEDDNLFFRSRAERVGE